MTPTFNEVIIEMRKKEWSFALILRILLSLYNEAENKINKPLIK